VSTAGAIKVPLPLSSIEIKDGIASFIRQAGVPESAAAQIRQGLNRTCSLNRQCYSKVTVGWKIVAGEWKIEYQLDDFGRITNGFLNGKLVDCDNLEASGVIEPMPPDRFRRESEQPIPAPTVVQTKPDDKAHTFSQSIRGRGKHRDV